MPWLWPAVSLSSREPQPAGPEPAQEFQPEGMSEPGEKPDRGHGWGMPSAPWMEPPWCPSAHTSCSGWAQHRSEPGGIWRGWGCSAPCQNLSRLSTQPGNTIGLKKKRQERMEGSVPERLEKFQRPPGPSRKLRGSLSRLFLPGVRQMSHYTKQGVLFQERFGRFRAILTQKLCLMQVYNARGKRKCKCKRGILSCGSSLCQQAASVLEVSYGTAKFSQLEAVPGSHRVCPERKRSCELNLTEFPLLCAVAIYFSHFSFKGRNTKSLLEGAGSILRNSLSDEIGAIINLAAYELKAISTFHSPLPQQTSLIFSAIKAQLRPPKKDCSHQAWSSLPSVWVGKRRRCFLVWIRCFGDRGSPGCFLRSGFVDQGCC